jgi:protein-tyrosine-phosphatase
MKDPHTHLITFVCTGNICRSPMAEYLLRAALPIASPWRVASAGVFAGSGMGASRAARDALDQQGLDLTPHRSRQFDREIIDASDVIVVMTAAHREQIGMRYPDAIEKIFLLKSFGASGGDVRDPIGLSNGTYRKVRDEISASIPDLIAFLNHLQVA